MPDTTIYNFSNGSRELLELCSQGQTLLFCQTSNISYGLIESKVLNSGFYTGRKVYCKQCMGLLGWNYLESDNKKISFKEGKTSIHSHLLKRSTVSNTGKDKISKELLDLEVPMESSVVSAFTARTTISDYLAANTYNIFEGIN